ncbi:MAG: hypothetical protein ACXWZW_06365 [Solirubrobacterales bacterium]
MHPLQTLIQTQQRQTRQQRPRNPQRGARERHAAGGPTPTLRKRVALALAAIIGRS